MELALENCFQLSFLFQDGNRTISQVNICDECPSVFFPWWYIYGVSLTDWDFLISNET